MMLHSDQPRGDSATIEPTVEPIPPRYWWLKRIGVVVGLLLVTLFTLRLWWGWEANRRLQAEIDKIIAAGEPIYPEDFGPKEEIPDDQNAARLLLQAATAVNLTTEQMKLLQEFRASSAVVREHFHEVRAIIEDNAQAFELLRRARGASSTDWGVSSHTPMATFNAILPVLDGQRQLARLLHLGAMHQHQSGDDRSAVGKLRDLLALSDAVSRQGTVIALLTGLGCEGLFVNAIEETAPTLALRAECADTAPSNRAADRSEIQAMIADLLDKPTAKRRSKNAMLWERMYQFDLVQQVVQGKVTVSAWLGLGSAAMAASVWDTTWNYLSAPLVQLDALSMLLRSSLRTVAAEKPSWAEVKATLPEEAPDRSVLDSIIHPFSRIMYPSLDRTLLNHFRALARRRLAATALGIRLYEVDHGQRPEALADLVPVYLPQIPKDPFADNGQTLRYLPYATHPVVYSIGENGLDEEGKVEKRAGDVVFFLDGWRQEDDEDDKVSPPPSIQAGEDQHNVDEDDRQGDEEESGEEEP